MSPQEFGEEHLFSALEALSTSQGTLPEHPEVTLRPLLENLLQPDVAKIAPYMFSDPMSAQDYSDLAKSSGDDALYLYKEYPGDFPTLPPELSHGFILTLMRDLDVPLIQLYVRDKDIDPDLEYTIAAAMFSAMDHVLRLTLTTRLQKEGQEYTW